MANNLMQVIAQLRRDMPRNAAVQLVCGELESRLTKPDAPLKLVKQRVVARDRKAYMRDYMKKWRLRQKKGSAL